MPCINRTCTSLIHPFEDLSKLVSTELTLKQKFYSCFFSLLSLRRPVLDVVNDKPRFLYINLKFLLFALFYLFEGSIFKLLIFIVASIQSLGLISLLCGRKNLEEVINTSCTIILKDKRWNGASDFYMAEAFKLTKFMLTKLIDIAFSVMIWILWDLIELLLIFMIKLLLK